MQDSRMQRLREIQAWFVQQNNEAAKYAAEHPGSKPRFLAVCTMFDIQLAATGFLDFCEEFFMQFPRNFLIPRQVNQDALENHFSIIRSQGAANQNPTLSEFQDRTQRTVVAGQFNLAPKKGNSASKKLGAAINAPLLKAYGGTQLASGTLRKRRASRSRLSNAENCPPNTT